MKLCERNPASCPAGSRCGSAVNRELTLMQWGLIPWFSKDGKPSFSTINARAEGLRTAASYREPFAKGRRCIVPASGYFEWTGPKNDVFRARRFANSYDPEGVGRSRGVRNENRRIS
jgi:putative SOS response-associated peptidase YedK